jgi:hypothetical protein
LLDVFVLQIRKGFRIIIWVYRWYILFPLIAIAIGQFVLLIIGRCSFAPRSRGSADLYRDRASGMQGFRTGGGRWDADDLICVHSDLDDDVLGAYSIYSLWTFFALEAR